MGFHVNCFIVMNLWSLYQFYLGYVYYCKVQYKSGCVVRGGGCVLGIINDGSADDPPLSKKVIKLYSNLLLINFVLAKTSNKILTKKN